MTDDLARAAHEGTRSSDSPSRHRKRLRGLEWIAILHVAGFALGATWAFGGQADWVRGPLTAWGCAGFAITLAATLESSARRAENRVVLWWALPVLLFNVLVLAATFNPSIREVRFGGETNLAVFGGRPGWPSSARPELARTALLQFDAIWLSCVNIALVIRRRRAIRLLLIIVAANAVVLAVFGTIQKLVHASGLYFGSVPSPQEYFFSTFVYHNHWGAYALLMISVLLGLGSHFARRHSSRDVFHSPAMLLVVAILIVVATIPLSGSRSSTILAILLLGGTFLRWTVGLVRKRRHLNESAVPPLALAAVGAAIAVAAVWDLGRPMIERRLEITAKQIAAVESHRDSDARIRLYRDTWRMAHEKPWFGWGMASYPYVFTLYNTRPSDPRFPTFFHDAHNDWLQALAEHGFVGSALLAAAVLAPLVTLRRNKSRAPIAGFPLVGCATIAAYAVLEFPFGNFAVVLTWWLCFFAAVQYARLTALRPQYSPALATRTPS